MIPKLWYVKVRKLGVLVSRDKHRTTILGRGQKRAKNSIPIEVTGAYEARSQAHHSPFWGRAKLFMGFGGGWVLWNLGKGKQFCLRETETATNFKFEQF